MKEKGKINGERKEGIREVRKKLKKEKNYKEEVKNESGKNEKRTK